MGMDYTGNTKPGTGVWGMELGISIHQAYKPKTYGTHRRTSRITHGKHGGIKVGV